VIRLEIGRKVPRKLRALGPEVVSEAERRLTQLAQHFGSPHAHSGLGLRKLGRRSYEIRLGRQWRLVFVHHGGALLIDDVLNHDGVAKWLKQRGD